MTLLAPLMLLGLAGLALPVIAHLLGRERPRPVAFAALRFVRPGEEVVTHRRRLRDHGLLIVRLLMLAALVVALARPSAETTSSISVIASPHDAVILIDGSRSMELQVQDGSRRARPLLEQAAEVASNLTHSLPAGSRVALVTTDPDGPVVELTADPARVRRAAEAWASREGTPRAGSWTMGGQIVAAAALLARHGQDTGRERAIYAIGDRTARGLGSLPRSVEGVPIVPVPVLISRGLESPDQGQDQDQDQHSATDPRPEHISVEGVTWEPARDIDPRAVRIHGAVRRHGPAAQKDRDDGAEDIRRVAVTLRIGDETIARSELEVPAGGPAPFEFTHTVSGAAGPRAAIIAIEPEDAQEGTGDPMPGDDAAYLWLSVNERVHVTVINGDPSEIRTHDEVFFLATAIGNATAGRSLEIHGLAPEQFEERLRRDGVRGLSDTDVLVLANVRAPPEDISPAIVAAVERGMGLWITVGERVRAQEYNDRLGAMLPLPLREAVVAGTAPGRAEARTEGLAPADLTHPALRGLTGDLGLTGTRTRRMFLLEPDPTRETEIAIAYTNGAPALITRDHGRGRVAVLTTSVDRDWSDLPLRPGFLPLVERTLVYLASARRGATSSRLRAGEPWVFPADRPVSIHTPGGAVIPVAPDTSGLVTFEDTIRVGHYRVERVPGDEGAAQRPPPVCSVNVDPVESETAPSWSPAAGPGDDTNATFTKTRLPRWRPLVWLVVLLLVGESALRWRKARRRPRA